MEKKEKKTNNLLLHPSAYSTYCAFMDERENKWENEKMIWNKRWVATTCCASCFIQKSHLPCFLRSWVHLLFLITNTMGLVFSTKISPISSNDCAEFLFTFQWFSSPKSFRISLFFSKNIVGKRRKKNQLDIFPVYSNLDCHRPLVQIRGKRNQLTHHQSGMNQTRVYIV